MMLSTECTLMACLFRKWEEFRVIRWIILICQAAARGAIETSSGHHTGDFAFSTEEVLSLSISLSGAASEQCLSPATGKSSVTLSSWDSLCAHSPHCTRRKA
uniref:Uncharacterized protein n=1 Tax=Sphaerodactylus townsendi TaxID=933632 RepID=A0ACB8G253_9SAUR